jgi:hypothetical protein
MDFTVDAKSNATSDQPAKFRMRAALELSILAEWEE